MTSLKEEAQLKKHFSSPLFILPTRKLTNGADNINNNNIMDTSGPLRPSHSLSQMPFTKHNRSASIGTPRTPKDDPAHEQQRRLCLSASDINFPRVSSELQLHDAKSRCDIELNAYLEELPSILPNNDMTEEVLRHVLILQDAIRAMISFSIDDLKHGKYTEVIQKIQKLHQFFVKSRLPHVQLITRPLLIISRVSRLAEHLGSQPEKDIDLEDDDLVEMESGHLTIQTGARLEVVPEATSPSSQVHDKGTSPQGKKIGLQFVNFLVDKVKKWKTRSAKTSPSSSVNTTPISTPPTPSALQDNTLWLLCRVCEERVRSDLLEEHSRECVAESQADLLITESDERINKLIHAVVRHNKRTNSSMALASRHTDLASLCQRAMASRDEKELDELLSVHLAALLQEDAKGTPAKAAGLEALMRRAEVLFKEKKSLVAAANAIRSGPARNIKKHGIQDFEFIKPISRGAFGRVFLAKNKNTGDLYAVKVLNKRQAVQKNQVSHIKTERNTVHLWAITPNIRVAESSTPCESRCFPNKEGWLQIGVIPLDTRDILSHTFNPFLVQFFYSFQTKQNLYMVMEFIPGGDLYSLLRALGCFSEDMARMYIAEVVLALEYLHSLSIIHRDLKPDNLLVTHDGHIKVTDYGLSRYALLEDDLDRTRSPATPTPLGPLLSVSPTVDGPSTGAPQHRQRYHIVGTPDYLAPEVILGTKHGHQVDWWSIGIILYEFLTGIPPFNAETPQAIFENILNGNIEWPEDASISDVAKDLILKLLNPDPTDRLGHRGAAEVKAHPFFKGVNWETLRSEPPIFIPKMADSTDTSYFESRHEWSGHFSQGSASSGLNSSSGSSRSTTSSSSLGSSGSDSIYTELCQLVFGVGKCPTHLAEGCGDDNEDKTDVFMNFSFKNLPNLVALTRQIVQREPSQQNLVPGTGPP